MATQTTNTKKKLAIAGGSLLLVAGVTVGGALVTANSTIFDNVFQTEVSDTTADGELIVSGAPMTNVFTGAMNGEVITGYYEAENTSENASLAVSLSSYIQPSGAQGDALADALSTRVSVNGGDLVETGTLSDMALKGADGFVLAPHEKVKIRIDVYVADADAFVGLGLDGAKVTADYRFDSIAKSE